MTVSIAIRTSNEMPQRWNCKFKLHSNRNAERSGLSRVDLCFMRRSSNSAQDFDCKLFRSAHATLNQAEAAAARESEAQTDLSIPLSDSQSSLHAEESVN